MSKFEIDLIPERTLDNESGYVWGASWSSNGEIVAIAGRQSGPVTLWNSSSGELVSELVGVNGTSFAVAFAPDRPEIAFGGRGGGVVIRDSSSGSPIAEVPGGGWGTVGVGWAPDGTHVAAIGGGGMGIWSFPTLKRRVEAGNAGQALTWSNNGLRLATVSPKLRIWNPATGKCTRIVGAGGGQSIDWHPLGRLIATGTDSDGLVRIWDPDEATLRSVIHGHTGRVLAVAWSKDGNFLMTGGAEGSLRLWWPQAGAESVEIHRFERPVLSLAWSPIGSRVIVGLASPMAHVFSYLFVEGDWAFGQRLSNRYRPQVSGLFHSKPLAEFALPPSSAERDACRTRDLALGGSNSKCTLPRESKAWT